MSNRLLDSRHALDEGDVGEPFVAAAVRDIQKAAIARSELRGDVELSARLFDERGVFRRSC